MLIIILAVALSLVTFIAIKVGIKEYSKKKRIYVKEGLKPYLAFLWLLIIPVKMITFIDKNTVGVIFDEISGISERTLPEGTHFVSPFQTIIPIETSYKDQTITVSGQTSDSIYADFTVTIVYRIDDKNASQFYKTTNSTDITSSQFNSITKEVLQSISTQYEIYSILGDGLETFRVEFTNDLQEEMAKRYYVEIISTSIDDVDAGEKIEEIIRAKGEALQQIEIEKLNKEKAEIQKQILITEAEADAEVIKIAAQAQADKIEYEKRALANMISEYVELFPDMTQQEVATLVLQTVFYDKWDGKLPEVMTDEALEALIGSLIK